MKNLKFFLGKKCCSYRSIVPDFDVETLRIGECPSNSLFLKDNGAEAHCF